MPGIRPQNTAALENATLSTFPTSSLFDLGHNEFVMVHEAAHQWFDDSFKELYEFDQQVRDATTSIVVSPVPEAIFGLGRGSGSLVVYALRQHVGEQKLQQITQTFLDRYRDRGERLRSRGA
ncbi:hypothetical protein NLX83_32945 [Allokutzneria sp. A3M-2-11 16]|uniref:hypothetical protein n=1 Tax=Allokutzneria sp. A3M-2-11 16 TaxID=2962043 RepID=UPI0020B71484|nr:hypothetical protein [Allokutzneria sp. A3M-2-11 16]MCP3804090.1 hypothetical protein [Allokutzneria sp. A3M-2-11 16]